jgi:hypothetical protein
VAQPQKAKLLKHPYNTILIDDEMDAGIVGMISGPRIAIPSTVTNLSFFSYKTYLFLPTEDG